MSERGKTRRTIDRTLRRDSGQLASPGNHPTEAALEESPEGGGIRRCCDEPGWETRVRYYDLIRNWTRKIEPHLGDQELNDILVRDFNLFTKWRCNQEFRHGQYPRDFETCLWEVGHRGKEPRYWRYVRHSACHWLVNFFLRLAMLSEPKRPWRIITSPLHSTVWDGQQTLFDFAYRAMGVPARQCFGFAFDEELPPGQYMAVYEPGRWPERSMPSLRFARFVVATFPEGHGLSSSQGGGGVAQRTPPPERAAGLVRGDR